MGKYMNLQKYLMEQQTRCVTLRMEEIEKIISSIYKKADIQEPDRAG